MEILTSYSFRIIAMGTVLLAIVSTVVGSINVYKGQSLIGDAMGHSTFAGIVLAYMMFQTRNPIVLLIGAMLSAALAYLLIEYSNRNSKIGLDANLAIYLSGFFGIGMVLKSYIQGNPNFENASQSGLQNYIFGQAAYLLELDVKLIAIATVICLSIVLLLFREFKIYLFDREFAQIAQLPIKLMDYLVLFMTILVIGVGIKAVGAILISSFLIVPCISANQWTNKFSMVMILGAIFSSISVLIGSYISMLYTGLSTGPSIIIVSGIICGLSFLLGKNGIFRRRGDIQ
ncbi:metal ABC transporter permease [Helcococcus sueciensis]|uniref:metal ABC transporter permease n=1 Tax=Helcococcus sueciensis TaxID=241555 RepID=UPI00040283AB|nr:metal ABC transporter permease [Helcococcus sueciensis]